MPRPLVLGDCLGKGAFGVVYKAVIPETRVCVAVKEIKTSRVGASDLHSIMVEIDLLKRLNHPNIVAYRGFTATPDSYQIIMEFCENGSLYDALKKTGKLSEDLSRSSIAQVLEGLRYLHEQGVIHRDIKAANILTTKSGIVKLADFGVASKLADASSKNVAGSPYWMAPEIIELNGASWPSDIWSLGCTVIELMDGAPPYHSMTPMSALFHIVQDDHPPLPHGISNFAADFLSVCFHKDANFRPSAGTLLKHPWITKPSANAPASSRTNHSKCDEENSNWDEDFDLNESAKTIFLSKRCTPSAKKHPPIKLSIAAVKGQPQPSMLSPVTSPAVDRPTEVWDDDFEFQEMAGFPLTPTTPTTKAPPVQSSSPEIDSGDDYTNDFADVDLEFSSRQRVRQELTEDPFTTLLEESTPIYQKTHAIITEDRLIEMTDELITRKSTHAEISTLLVAAVRERQDLKRAFRKHHRLLPLLNSIKDPPKSDEQTISVLRVVTEIITKSHDLQNHLLLMGGVPAIFAIATHCCSEGAIKEVMLLLHAISCGPETLLAFLSCDGFGLLMSLLEKVADDQIESHKLVSRIISTAVSSQQERVSRDDMLHVLAENGLIPKLAAMFPRAATLNSYSWSDDLSTIFLDLSKSGPMTLQRTAESIEVIAPCLPKLPQPSLSVFVKCLKNLSAQPSIVDVMGRGCVVESLVSVLSSANARGDVQHSILQTVFNICHLSRGRLERAVRAGITPHVLRLADSASPLRGNAIPLICEIVCCDQSCRATMREAGGLALFLKLLNDVNWHVNALESLANWLVLEPTYIERALLKQPPAFVACLKFGSNVEQLLGVFHKLLSASSKILRTIVASHQPFMAELALLLKKDHVGVRYGALRLIALLRPVGPQQGAKDASRMLAALAASD
ncbi:hypothetical protein DFJ73DRAFT_637988, partial [Zopfochytrium polystomum]